jgi:solute carrier family 25 citrate transporter 1
VHCAATILKEQGPRGLWAGATPTVMRNGTNQMCLFAMKNNCDKWLWDKHEGDGRVLSPHQVQGAHTLRLTSQLALGCFR